MRVVVVCGCLVLVVVGGATMRFGRRHSHRFDGHNMYI